MSKSFGKRTHPPVPKPKHTNLNNNTIKRVKQTPMSSTLINPSKNDSDSQKKEDPLSGDFHNNNVENNKQKRTESTMNHLKTIVNSLLSPSSPSTIQPEKKEKEMKEVQGTIIDVPLERCSIACSSSVVVDALKKAFPQFHIQTCVESTNNHQMIMTPTEIGRQSTESAESLLRQCPQATFALGAQSGWFPYQSATNTEKKFVEQTCITAIFQSNVSTRRFTQWSAVVDVPKSHVEEALKRTTQQPKTPPTPLSMNFIKERERSVSTIIANMSRFEIPSFSISVIFPVCIQAGIFGVRKEHKFIGLAHFTTVNETQRIGIDLFSHQFDASQQRPADSVWININDGGGNRKLNGDDRLMIRDGKLVLSINKENRALGSSTSFYFSYTSCCENINYRSHGECSPESKNNSTISKTPEHSSISSPKKFYHDSKDSKESFQQKFQSLSLVDMEMEK